MLVDAPLLVEVNVEIIVVSNPVLEDSAVAGCVTFCVELIVGVFVDIVLVVVILASVVVSLLVDTAVGNEVFSALLITVVGSSVVVLLSLLFIVGNRVGVIVEVDNAAVVNADDKDACEEIGNVAVVENT